MNRNLTRSVNVDVPSFVLHLAEAFGASVARTCENVHAPPVLRWPVGRVVAPS